MQGIGFIGAGVVGTALAKKLSENGYSITAVSSHSLASAEKLAGYVSTACVNKDSQTVVDVAETVFITTPDDVITKVVSSVRWHKDQNVLHCSGADSLEILEPARKAGARVGAFHPLQTFASVEQAMDNMYGSTFALEAEEPLLSIIWQMARDLGGHSVVLKPGDKVLYHAAAVMACNYVVTLVKLATDLWAALGVSQAEAIQALMPLLKGTLNNIDNVGLPDCLTGPIARGDVGTIEKHLQILGSVDTEVLRVYREMGRQTVPISIAKGRIDQISAEDIQRLLA